jgi:hypothetical protein
MHFYMHPYLHKKKFMLVKSGCYSYFHVDEEGTLWFKDRLVVPKNHGLCKKKFMKPTL